jgi:fumarate hydratase class II
MPKAVYHAYGYIKKAAAAVNGKAGRLPAWKAGLIERVAEEVIAGKLDGHFPLYVWQTGSGTQSKMNVNEVISNRAIQLTGGQLGSKTPVHPNDDVNLGQSSNDTFPTAMHIAAVQAIHQHLLPSVRALQHAIAAKADGWRDVVKIGRTHLEDAVPLTVGQEWSGYAHQLSQAADQLLASAEGLFELASGPRCGLGELILPANEPGSSIMPGKVNPTQCEAMVMVCIQVLSEDTAIAFAATQGNFELNAMRPVIISNFLHAATILADACAKLRQYCIEGTELHRDQIDAHVSRPLMLVTALSPVIGYDKASAIAHKASDEGTTLREAALATGYVTADEFDRVVNPAAMMGA